MKKPLILSQFNNDEEVEDFLDKNSLADYLEPSDFKRVSFPNLKPTQFQKVSLDLPVYAIKVAQARAAKLNVRYTDLLQQYILQEFTPTASKHTS